MTDIVIASAARTPVGSFNGAFASLPAHALGTAAIKAAMERAGIEGGDVDEVILGQILAAGSGQNPARQAALAGGLGWDVPASGVNKVCLSGLTAIIDAKRMIASGDAAVDWNLVMATAILALIPPAIVVVLMQRWFVKGLVDTEK